jgi:hypothetical protein
MSDYTSEDFKNLLMETIKNDKEIREEIRKCIDQKKKNWLEKIIEDVLTNVGVQIGSQITWSGIQKLVEWLIANWPYKPF